MNALPLLKKHLAFLLYLVVCLLVRFWNYRNFLYFTWDQGRDAFVLQNILSGDLVLTGPTSGLHGFFLGPLWYYLGVPGFWLSGGSPYGISLWYIVIASMALPLYWIMAHRLFPSRIVAIAAAFFLALMPGSIAGTSMIWNPLVSLPLMSGAFLALWMGREDRKWLWLGFFLLALTLQSEFAYAVFFIVPLFALIPWIRRRFDLRDFLGAAVAIGLTLLPQLVFELRHDWIMTRSILSAMGSDEMQVTWGHLFSKRPHELFWYSSELFLGGWQPQLLWLTPILYGSIGAALVYIWQHRREKTAYWFGWKLLAVMAVLPYPFYLIWRGNYGNFFFYYLTPHFIFLAPLFILGLVAIAKLRVPFSSSKIAIPQIFSLAILTAFFIISWLNLHTHLTLNDSAAGLWSMERAVDKVYSWGQQDKQAQPLVRIFTPNLQTENYDFLFHWKARQLDCPVPKTVKTGEESMWYIMIEPDRQIPEKRFIPWYQEATAGGQLVRQEQVGILTLETWQQTASDSAAHN